jgi:hypothetical protein
MDISSRPFFKIQKNFLFKKLQNGCNDFEKVEDSYIVGSKFYT